MLNFADGYKIFDIILLMSIVTANEHDRENPRIKGIKLLNQVKVNLRKDFANTVNARIVTALYPVN
jgi:hypothetical protein